MTRNEKGGMTFAEKYIISTVIVITSYHCYSVMLLLSST